MTPERLRKIETLFHEAQKKGREALSGVDPGLRREVEELLEGAKSSTESFDLTQWQTGVSGDLKPGDTLGPYRIEGMIGRGGMGTVFRATDSRLNRKVAVKMCDARFAERFQREARTIAALNHPHICTVYDVGPNYLVMELIEGETLASKLRRGLLPVTDVLRYGEEIADAMAEAHTAGIAHRDLKPGNIMLTARGVKVLDFGLAKQVNTTGAGAATHSHGVLGTPAYMAPEQALGKSVDERADIFSLGIVLHEMATGKLPYSGASFGAMLAADPSITAPAISACRQDVPASVSALVSRMLAPDPSQRPASAAVVRDEIRALGGASPDNTRRRLLVAIPAAMAAAALIGAGAWWSRSREPDRLEVVSTGPILSLPGDKVDPAFSPDGAMLAFSWQGEKGDAPGIYIASLAGGEPRRITTAAARDVTPSWSPDGQQIAYQHVRSDMPSALMVVPVAGGTPRQLRELRRLSLEEATIRFTWTPDGKAVILPMYDAETLRTSLFRVATDGSSPVRIVKGQGDMMAQPSLSPDGKWLAYVDNWVLRVQPMGADGLPQGAPTRVHEDIVIVSPTWHQDSTSLLFLTRSRIMSWDLNTQSLQTVYVASSGVRNITASWADTTNPKIVASTVSGHVELRTLPLSENGRQAAGPPQTLFQDAYSGAYSPDGRWVTFVLASGATGSGELWITDAEGRQPPRRITNVGGGIREPRWSPDGRHIAFHSRISSNAKAQVSVVDIDPRAVMARPVASQPDYPTRKITNTDFDMVSPQWSPDGKYLYVLRVSVGRTRIPADGGEMEFLFPSNYANLDAAGKWIYYIKRGSSEIFRRSLSGDIPLNLDESVVQDAREDTAFAVTDKGIYYVAADAAQGPKALAFYDFGLRRSFKIGPPPELKDRRLTLVASPSGDRLLFEAQPNASSSLTLLELRQEAR